MPDKSFSMRLKVIRTARGLTQAALAKRLKVPQSFVARLETRSNPTLDTLRRLAKVLKVTVGELVE